ncbi:MAG: DUF488 domain-containing protein [Gemmatimonadaceae bacterium]
MADFVYTIGHSTHSIAKLIELVTARGVTTVADVRSQPYSRFSPQFNREDLKASLKTAGISYAFLGRELGARPEDGSCYINGAVQYDLLASTNSFQEGLRRVTEGARSHTIALMCAEKDPLSCHRAILVCRHLSERGIAIQHILEDGRVESHDDALTRLLAELRLEEHDLFRSRDELILEAYNLRGHQIAYIETESSSNEAVRGAPR